MRVDYIAGQFGIAFGSPFSRVPLHRDILALDVAKATELLEKSPERPTAVDRHVADFFRRMDHRDALYLCRLLRSYGERPCSRSTKCRDEIAPSHLTRLRRCPTHCPNYSNLERSARDKWHLPVQDAGRGSMSLMVQSPQFGDVRVTSALPPENRHPS